MATYNHTDIAVGAAANASTFNTPLGTLDAAIGDLTGMTTTPKTSVAGAIGATALTTTAQTLTGALAELDAQIGSAASVSGSIGVSIDTDGTLRAGVVTGPKLEAGVLAPANLLFDPFNVLYTSADTTWGGRNRFTSSSATITFVDPDASNPFGAPTLRVSALAVGAGKYIYSDEAGLIEGETLQVAIIGNAPLTSTYRADVSFYDAFTGGSGISALHGTTAAGTGSMQVWTVSGTIPAGARRAAIFLARQTGADGYDVYGMQAYQGSFTADIAGADSGPIYGPRISGDAFYQAGNLVPDPFNRETSAGYNWDGRPQWINPANLSTVDPDAANPFGAPTLRVGTTYSTGGRRVYLDKHGVLAGAQVYGVCYGLGNAATTYRLDLVFRDSGLASVGSVTGTAAAGTGAAQLFTAATTIPATTWCVDVYMTRTAGAANVFDIYGLGLYVNGYRPEMPGPAEDHGYAHQPFPAAQDYYLQHSLRAFRGQVAKIRQAAAGEQVVVALVGDSWVDNQGPNSDMWAACKLALQTELGDAGVGWVSATSDAGGSLPSEPDMVTFSDAGTWVYTDQTGGPLGPDLADARTTDTATPASQTLAVTATDIDIHYYTQVNGASFRWKIGAGAWTDVDTNAAAGFAVEHVTGLGAGSHTLTVEIMAAPLSGSGAAGLILLGYDPQVTGVNGARLHKVGNPGANALQFSTVAATTWVDALEALDPHLIIFHCGTNDHGGSIVPDQCEDYYDTIYAALQSVTRSDGTHPDVLILAPAENGMSMTYPFARYVSAQRDAAQAAGCAMLDASLSLGSYADADARGLWNNVSHISVTGGQVYADLLLDFLRL